MKLLISIITFTFICFNLVSQEKFDTIYFDKNWEEVNKELSVFYRLRTTKKVSGRYVITDYFNSGKIQMTGFLKSFKPDIKDGVFKYYDEEGHFTSIGYYKRDIKNSEWISYWTNGNMKSFTEYEDGKYDGKLILFYENGLKKREEKYEKNVFRGG